MWEPLYTTSTIKNQSETEITEGKYSQFFKSTETGVISILRYKTDTIRYLSK